EEWHPEDTVNPTEEALFWNVRPMKRGAVLPIQGSEQGRGHARALREGSVDPKPLGKAETGEDERPRSAVDERGAAGGRDLRSMHGQAQRDGAIVEGGGPVRKSGTLAPPRESVALEACQIVLRRPDDEAKRLRLDGVGAPQVAWHLRDRRVCLLARQRARP